MAHVDTSDGHIAVPRSIDTTVDEIKFEQQQQNIFLVGLQPKYSALRLHAIFVVVVVRCC